MSEFADAAGSESQWPDEACARYVSTKSNDKVKQNIPPLWHSIHSTRNFLTALFIHTNTRMVCTGGMRYSNLKDPLFEF